MSDGDLYSGKAHENILNGMKVIERTFSIRKLSKGHNSVKNVGGVTILFLCTSSDDGLYCTKFHENILNGMKVIEWT